MRVYPTNHFPIELQHKPEDAVSCGVLRPEIYGEIAKRGFWHGKLAVIIAGFRRRRSKAASCPIMRTRDQSLSSRISIS